jgi:hypothetical protein
MQDEHIATAALAKQAKASPDKEAYKQLEKTSLYRIGVGARAEAGGASFFLEVLLALSAGSDEVDLGHLEKALNCLKTLKARGYLLTFEDNNKISCEATLKVGNPNQEYLAVKSVLKSIFK